MHNRVAVLWVVVETTSTSLSAEPRGPGRPDLRWIVRPGVKAAAAARVASLSFSQGSSSRRRGKGGAVFIFAEVLVKLPRARGDSEERAARHATTAEERDKKGEGRGGGFIMTYTFPKLNIH